jgi:hypothetical protein
MFDAALSTKNLYRIGICTHSYADTWAHQNFVGYYEYMNGMGKVRKGLIEKLIPNIGHADAKRQPDIPGLIWEDGRLVKGSREIHNKERFVEAAEFIFKKFRKHLKPEEKNEKTEKDWSKLKKDLENAIGDEFNGKDRGQKQRIENYKKLVSDFREYNKSEWFDEAVETKVRGLKDKVDWGPLNAINLFPDKYYKKPGFEDSHWYHFQVAVKEHQKWANNLYFQLYQQLEVKEY